MHAIDPTQLHHLSAAILSDVMDSLGLQRRAMKPFVRPLDERHVMVGRARTGLYMPVYEARPGENPYEVEIALDAAIELQVQGGGFGSFSKGFGLAAASLLEAEIVTADGKVRVVNATQEPDLFWALKGGGAGWGITRCGVRWW